MSQTSRHGRERSLGRRVRRACFCGLRTAPERAYAIDGLFLPATLHLERQVSFIVPGAAPQRMHKFHIPFYPRPSLRCPGLAWCRQSVSRSLPNSRPEGGSVKSQERGNHDTQSPDPQTRAFLSSFSIRRHGGQESRPVECGQGPEESVGETKAWD